MLGLIWLIPLAPLAGFLIVGGLGLRGRLDASPAFAHRVAVLAAAVSFFFSLAAIWDFSHGLSSYQARAAAQPERYQVSLGDDTGPARFAVTPAVWMPLGETQLREWSGSLHRWRSVSIGWTFALDALTCVMLLVVTGIGTLIHIYSIGYMRGDPGYWRFFCYLNLFLSMMLTLVLAGNLPVMFVGWEGVGLCSYLLIGYFYDQVFDKESGMTCADAGRKAFITNRLGDFGFLLGTLLLMVTFGSWDFGQISSAINAASPLWYGSGILTLIGLLLFIGATGKSAQIPLYVWLPDAMAGPTPVSALIHAATMVTAGVYMLARMSSLYWHAPQAMLVVAVIGALTAFFAATMGMAQYDIKKVLAYSTVSQLGYMFLGAGVGAFTASIFHLVTHAFFKACLFLCAGSVIARCGHSNDMRLYGGLKKWMPVTYWTFLLSTLAITGFPLLSGFMSKDEILAKSLFSTRGHLALWAIGTVSALMTSFYMFRALYMTFHGENRSPAWVKAQLTESPRVMTGVLATLAAGAVLVGFIGVPEGVTKLVGVGDLNHFDHLLRPVVGARGVVARVEHESGGAEHGAANASAEHGAAPAEHGAAPAEHGAVETASSATGLTAADRAAATVTETGGVITVGDDHVPVIREGLRAEPSHAEEAGLFVLALGIFAGGLVLARWAYGNDGKVATALAPRLAYVRRLLHRKWLVDELYDLVAIKPFYRTSDGLSWNDNRIVDGLVNLTAGVTRFGGQTIKLFQTGVTRHYALWILAGAVVVIWRMMAR